MVTSFPAALVNDTVLVSFDGGVRPTSAIQYSFDTPDNGGAGGLPDDEAGLIAGDSGHPALLRIGDELALIGTHFGIDVSDGQQPQNFDRYDSFSTLVIPYLDQISTITLADGFEIQTLKLTAVPEPSTWFTLMVAASFVIVRVSNRESFADKSLESRKS